MKAAVFHQPGQPLSIETLPDPVPGPGQVLLKVGRCGICGTDLHMTEGHAVTLPPGSVPGQEFAGEIAALGAGVSGLKLGDRVTALPISGCGQCDACRAGKFSWCEGFTFRPGGYAEYVVAGAQGCLKLPDVVSLADGALVEPMAVGLHAVKLAGIRQGDKVLVIGAGPIGLAVTYWASRLGAGSLAVTAASRRREDLARRMGATAFFINDEQALESAKATLGGLPDLVIECVGTPGMIDRAVQWVRPRGTVMVTGFCIQPDSFLPFIAVNKEIRMLFTVLYGIEDFQQSIDAFESHGDAARAMVTDTVSLQELPAAFEALRQRSHQCKVLVDPWRTT